MVAGWDKTRDDKYPNCNHIETATYLNICKNQDSTRLYTLIADRLGTLMSTNYGHPDLTYWLTRYIKL